MMMQSENNQLKQENMMLHQHIQHLNWKWSEEFKKLKEKTNKAKDKVKEYAKKQWNAWGKGTQIPSNNTNVPEFDGNTILRLQSKAKIFTQLELSMLYNSHYEKIREATLFKQLVASVYYIDKVLILVSAMDTYGKYQQDLKDLQTTFTEIENDIQRPFTDILSIFKDNTISRVRDGQYYWTYYNMHVTESNHNPTTEGKCLSRKEIEEVWLDMLSLYEASQKSKK